MSEQFKIASRCLEDGLQEASHLRVTAWCLPHPGTSWEDLHTMTWDGLGFLNCRALLPVSVSQISHTLPMN